MQFPPTRIHGRMIYGQMMSMKFILIEWRNLLWRRCTSTSIVILICAECATSTALCLPFMAHLSGWRIATAAAIQSMRQAQQYAEGVAHKTMRRSGVWGTSRGRAMAAAVKASPATRHCLTKMDAEAETVWREWFGCIAGGTASTGVCPPSSSLSSPSQPLSTSRREAAVAPLAVSSSCTTGPYARQIHRHSKWTPTVYPRKDGNKIKVEQLLNRKLPTISVQRPEESLLQTKHIRESQAKEELPRHKKFVQHSICSSQGWVKVCNKKSNREGTAQAAASPAHSSNSIPLESNPEEHSSQNITNEAHLSFL
eukprot:TRINITY_DN4475_c0_g1_i3.p1 TRINITY_DN4475_c0_g1~~TRINITY_DN4475_c0_g1_i3.p1  ORF type:complete len:311 (-),score=42.37 TRINITY_DN4475_c0_g1_i3:67-999(-)